MTRHIRAAALAVMTSTIVATAFISAGASAVSVIPHAGPTVGIHHPRLAPTHAQPNTFGVTPSMMAAAQRVSTCEEGGNWHFVGTSFDGGIGWTPTNWLLFRKPTWPRFMHDAPPRMQANALFRFVRYFRISMPDQTGTCAGY